MSETYAYDLYLSFSPEDASWTRDWLLPRLEKAGLRIFVDYRDAQPGAPKINEMERAMLESAKTLLVLTPAYLKGDWNDFQSIMVQYLDPAGRQRRLLPLILKEVVLPLRLNMLVPLDFTDLAERDDQFIRLLGAFGKVMGEESGGGGEKKGEGEEEMRRGGEGEEPVARETFGKPLTDPVVMGMVRDLTGYVQRGKLVLFIGQDLPQALTGAPDRQTLANRLAEEKGLPSTLARGQGMGGGSLSAVAQQVMSAGNRFEFTQFLKRQLTGVQPGPFYRALATFLTASFAQGTVITTAYHRLLEAALENAGEYGLQVVTQDDMLPFLDTKAMTLFKLYGDIQQANLIVTEQDQNAFIRGRAAERQDIVDEVSRLFKQNSVLFLGVDLHDPVLQALFDDVAGGKFQIPAFAVWTGFSDAERQAFETNRGIRVIPVSELDLLTSLVTNSK